jgi:hypothetical protein
LNAYHAEKIHERWWDTNDPSCRGQTTISDHDAQQRSELANLGIHCTPANKDIVRGISRVRSLMMIQDDGRPMLYIFGEKCPNLVREIVKYRWAEGTETKNPKDLPADVDNHALDSMRYVLFTDYCGVGSVPTVGRHIWKPAHGVQLKVV